MGEVVHGPLVDHVGGGVVHGLQVVQHHLAALLVGDLLTILVLAQGVGGDDLILGVLPAAVIDHQMAQLLGHHVVEDVVGDLGMILGLGLHGQNVVALVVDLGEQGLLVLPGVEVFHHADLTVSPLVGDVQGGGDDDLVVFLNLAVDGDIDLAVLALHLLDLGVQAGGVLQVLVQLLPDVLGAVLPGPEVDLDEVHGGLEVQILQNVGSGDLVKVAVAEGGVGPDPDVLGQLHAVLLAEFVEGQRQILQVLVLAGDGLTLGVLLREALVAALGNAPVTVDVIALVLGFQDLAQLLDLLLHLQQAGNLQQVLLGLEGLDDLALGVLVVPVQLGTVVGDAAELFHIMDSIVGGHAHDGAHLIPAAIVVGRPALAAHPVKPLQDGVVGIALLLQVHACGKTGGAAADDADASVLIHAMIPPVASIISIFIVGMLNDIIIHPVRQKCTTFF